MKKVVFVLLLLAVAGGIFLGWPGRGDDVQLDVPEGTNPRRIAQELVSRDLLKSPWPFLAWVRLRNAAQKIHAGRYQFAHGRSAFWLVDDMISGHTRKIHVTVPEGFASWQIAERLASAGVCDAAGFLAVVKEQKLEGFLFPATYEFDAAQKPAAVAARFKAKFEDSWTSEMNERAVRIGFTKVEAVTMASIIEREVRVLDEAPTVSAVYHNRLKQGLKLEADPTVQYAKGEWVSRLTYADYRNTRSPYNTYIVKGLPPGPICNPGMNSLKAALWPSDSKALYFVAGEEGHHNFSENYRDHTNNVNKRNRLRRAQKK